ncbi:hypothetical protein OHA79_37645 [Streptomyces sp. NBC_00841]|nr:MULTISPECIES: hypothetical protein [unclassified Streptomyces]MCX4531353.1 hypothetical protein [Streptomyces sp. NBC_01669]WSA03065.1 hypothetical protein OHA79_37645 [Streptomyces sp. NBC_00841]
MLRLGEARTLYTLVDWLRGDKQRGPYAGLREHVHTAWAVRERLP